MILLLFSVINQSLKEVVIFCLFFVPLRSYAGGLHLNYVPIFSGFKVNRFTNLLNEAVYLPSNTKKS